MRYKYRIFGMLFVISCLFIIGCGRSNQNDTSLDIQNSNIKNASLVINMTDHKYHREGCPQAGPNPIGTSLADAKKNGYRPCNKCDPPQ